MFEAGANSDIWKNFRLGGVVDRKRCGGVLQYDRIRDGGNEVVGGKSCVNDIGRNESVSRGNNVQIQKVLKEKKKQ